MLKTRDSIITVVYVHRLYVHMHINMRLKTSLFIPVCGDYSFILSHTTNMMYYIFSALYTNVLTDQSHKSHVIFSTQTHAHDEVVILMYSTIHHPALCTPSQYYSLK